jgi:diguanylate cyclase (GGDEF)-like protein/PAS domain S-box-containing protein
VRPSRRGSAADHPSRTRDRRTRPRSPALVALGALLCGFAGGVAWEAVRSPAEVAAGAVAIAAAALVFAGGVVVALGLSGIRIHLRRRARAARREAVLSASARALLAAHDEVGVVEEVVRTAVRLAEQPGATCEVWEEDAGRWDVTVADGARRSHAIAGDDLPVVVTAGLGAGVPWMLGREQAHTLQTALQVPVRYESYLIAPLPRASGPRAAVVLSCPRQPDADLLGLLTRYVTEAALAEDRAVLLDLLAEREARLARIIDHSSDVIAVLDRHGRFTMINRSGEVRFGHRSVDVVGRDVLDLIHPDDRPAVAEVLATGQGTAGRPIGCRLATADGRWRHVEAHLTVQEGGEEGCVLNVRDVTDRKALEAEIIHQAFHDPLTKLANRALFTDRLGHAIDRSRLTGEPVALVLVDLDDFKPVNDTYGHQAGDAVLVELADRLRTEVRDSDTVARFGGDEFAIVVEDAGDPDALASLVSRLEVATSGPVVLGPVDVVTVGASIGVATSSPASTPDTLIRRADEALYSVKFGGRARGGGEAGVGFVVRDPGPPPPAADDDPASTPAPVAPLPAVAGPPRSRGGELFGLEAVS